MDMIKTAVDSVLSHIQGTVINYPLSGNSAVSRNQITEEKLLGTGNASTVYQADLRGEKVAVKKYDPSMKGSYSIVFDNERKILSLLNHPNLLKLLGYVDEPDYKAVIVSLALHGDMHNYLECNKAEARNHVFLNKVLFEVAKALVYLHSSNIIHKDVKAENVLFDDSDSAILADYSLSLVIPPGDNITLRGKQCGSPRWAPPEINGGQTLKYDIYCFAWLALVASSKFLVEPANVYRYHKAIYDVSASKYIPPEIHEIQPDTQQMILTSFHSAADKRPDASEWVEHLKTLPRDTAKF